MVIMSSSIARGRVRTTTATAATELPNMAAILQIGWERERYSLGLPCTSLILDIHAMINWHLSKQGIRWPVSRDLIAGSSLQLVEATCFCEVDRWPRCWFSDWIAGLCQVNWLKTGQDCSEAGLRIKSWLNYNFFFYSIVFCCFVLCIWWF